MFLIALRDLQFRLRRFAISVVAVALILALTLLLAGVAASFDAEINHTLGQIGVDNWIVPSDASGPFLGAVPMSADVVAQVQALPGVEQAAPQAFYAYTLTTPHGPRGVSLFGAEPGKLGAPAVSKGRGMQQPGEIVMSPAFGYGIGDTITLGDKQFTIVGTVEDSTMLGGIPNVFMGLDDLQQMAYKGAPVITSVAIRGTPSQVPPDLKVLNRADAHRDLVRPVGSAKSTMLTMSVLLWIVTGCIVGSVIYISALERQRDFAVFKAIGIATRWVLGGLVFQAVILALAASAAAIAVGFLMAPRLSIPVTLPLIDVVLIPALAVVVAILATFVGASRAVRVDPALAFG